MPAGRKAIIEAAAKRAAMEAAAKRAAMISAADRVSKLKENRNTGVGAFNKVLVDIVGGAVDLSAAGLDAIRDKERFPEPIFTDPEHLPFGGQKSLRSGAQDLNIKVNVNLPENLSQAAFAGLGDVAVTFAPILKVLGNLRKGSGAAARIADEMYLGMNSKTGLVLETGGAVTATTVAQYAREKGAPEWMANSLAIAGGVGGAVATIGTIKGTRAVVLAVGSATDNIQWMKRVKSGASIAGKATYAAGGDLARMFIPMTQHGAFKQAAKRVRDVIGGDVALGDDIASKLKTDANPLGITPADASENAGIRGLAARAGLDSDANRVYLENVREGSLEAATRALGTEGEIDAVRDYFRQNFIKIKNTLTAEIDEAIRSADAEVVRVGDIDAVESVTSARMVGKIKDSLVKYRAEETELWHKIDELAEVTTASTREVIADFRAHLPKARKEDIPEIAVRLLGRKKPDEPGSIAGSDEELAWLVALMEGAEPTSTAGSGQIKDTDTVGELLGLYSKLRQRSRELKAGDAPDFRTASLADDIADAILDDLGTLPGVEIAEARAFSRALHELFDQGAVGRLLQRLKSTDEAIDPRAAMDRTVGRPGVQSLVDVDTIQKAAPDTTEDFKIYFRMRFAAAARNDIQTAQNWTFENREVLGKLGLLDEFDKAATSRVKADVFAARLNLRLNAIEASPATQFGRGKVDDAVSKIIGSDNPAREARSLVAAAKQIDADFQNIQYSRPDAANDPGGSAFEGLQSAFYDYLVKSASDNDGLLSGRQLKSLMRDGPILKAMRQIFDPDQIAAIQIIGRDLAKQEAAVAAQSAVIDTPANKLLTFVVSIQSAKTGSRVAQAGAGSGPGAGLVIAGFFTKVARGTLYYLTNTEAKRMLENALLRDRKLLRALLQSTPDATILSKKRFNLLEPYLVGIAAGVAGETGTQR